MIDAGHDEQFHAGDPAPLLARLHRYGVRHVDGGVTIGRFLAAGLLDDLTLSVIPLLLGDGVRQPPQELLADRDVEPAQAGGERLDVVAAVGDPRGVGQVRFVRRKRSGVNRRCELR